MTPVTIAKFGGSALGVDGALIPRVIDRIKQMSKQSKVVAVFSAPLTNYENRTSSMTDVALRIGKSYASSMPVEIEVLRDVYERIMTKYVSEDLHEEFLGHLDKFYRLVIISLKQAAENRRFVDVTRSRVLAYSGEVTMSYLMDYVMQSNGIKSSHVDIASWPVITDDNFEAANFMVEESLKNIEHLISRIDLNDVVSMGGFIGLTTDKLETTYERGGSDRTAADIAILLTRKYQTQVSFEKDSAVFSADPKIVKEGLDFVKFLSYNEAKLAGMFGMKILDPIAIKEIDDNDLDIPIVITNMTNPQSLTRIHRGYLSGVDGDDDSKTVNSSDQINSREETNDNPIKIVTGKKNCALVRMEANSALYLVAALERDKQYHDFIKLSSYRQDDIEITRLLFLDADYVRRHERHFRAYYPKAEIVYERGVVTLIGDQMWKVPNIVSTATSTVGEHSINILNLDAQEETSRILIVVEDKASNVADAVRAIHEKRNKIYGINNPTSGRTNSSQAV